jgi:hypothetical protein
MRQIPPSTASTLRYQVCGHPIQYSVRKIPVIRQQLCTKVAYLTCDGTVPLLRRMVLVYWHSIIQRKQAGEGDGDGHEVKKNQWEENII